MKLHPLARSRPAPLLLVLLGCLWTPPVGAQPLEELVASCEALDPDLADLCLYTGLSLRASHAALGLAASGGADVPGSASTLGWRLKGSPRIGFSLKGTVVRTPFPTLTTGGETSGEGTNENFPSLHASVTVGLFDGFSLRPTVGGVGSIDLVMSSQWIAAPARQGLGRRELGVGVGARVGILRESFSLPGVTFSIMRRTLGDVRLNHDDTGKGFQSFSDLSVVSIRGVAGKDLGGIGFFAGAGWDRSNGTANILVRGYPGSGSSLSEIGYPVPNHSVDFDRFLYFAGGSMTFLAFQVSVEAGLAEGLDEDLPGRGATGFDLGKRSSFLSLGFRLTF